MMLRLLSYLKPFRGLVAVTFVVMALSSFASLASPYVQRLTIDFAIEAGDRSALQGFALLFVAAATVQWLAGVVYAYLLARAAYEMLRAVRRHLFVHLQTLSLSFYDRYKVGRLMSIMTGDIGAISNFLSTGLVQMAADIFVLIGVIVVLTAMNPRLALVTFIVLPIVVFASHKLSTRSRAQYREVRRWSAIANGTLAEGIAGARVTQAYVREDVNLGKFTDLLTNLRDSHFRASRITAMFGPTMDVISSFVTAVVLSYGGWLALNGDLTTGALVAFLAYTTRFFEPIRDLSVRYNSLQAAMAGAERVFTLIDTKATVVDEPGARPLPLVHGTVTFDNVQFGYAPDRPVLQDLNLEIKPGEQVAIVGPTGAGKTSIISLVCRFYDVTSGEIRIDGHSVREVTMNSLRGQIGLVLQDPYLFSGTIADNLRFARPGATQADMEATCRAVGLHDFIMAQPGGYQTMLNERGANLSAGQRQLMSFARALLANPRILILDEATANVDTQTEAEIQAALKALIVGRTAIIIAHRLSTVRSADRIVVLEAGRIVEVGGHSELVRAGGHYARLHNASAALV